MDSVTHDFDFYAFKAYWGKTPKSTCDPDPEVELPKVLDSISSHHLLESHTARKNLNAIQSEIRHLLADPADKERYLKGMKLCASLSAGIYSHIFPDREVSDLGYFFKTLLEFDGKGPYFAFKAVYQGRISVDVMEKTIPTVSEPRRLAFVDQYIQTDPHVRLKFGLPFKRILKSIEQRESVVEFFADLFDRQRNADPFLNNIPPDLRDPDQIIVNEIRSLDSGRKITGLKALAMIMTKIPTDLLIDILARADEKVRIAIYNIVENSSIGTYPELFYPILQFFYIREKQEAFQAFKALAVSGKFPLYTVLEMIQQKYPALMPIINAEIASLSKISFFFIQDIALNKKKYKNSSIEVNFACILGMIKKRPERIIQLIKERYSLTEPAGKEMSRFIQKTDQLLALEKTSIDVEFEPIIQFVKKESRKSESATEKKIDDLKDKKQMNSLLFEGELIKKTDLSSFSFFSPALCFSKCIFYTCNFSNTIFSNTIFEKSIFCNIDMRQTRFDTINFDNAVFINVNAKGATFKNCSFQNISVYNCNFSDADLRDSLFLNARISKASFDQADLSGSCFAYSKISSVSFVTSNMNQADFSDVSARFCRFSYNAKSTIRTENLDYNARKYQLCPEDIPKLEESIVADINMIIFCEFIHYGEMKFLKQNQISLLTAFDIFKAEQADLFQIIPFLLHENIVFPGIEKIDDQTPCGICDYLPSQEIQEVLKKYVSLEHLKFRRHEKYAVEGLFTIGSIGSIAQTKDSDIDYWVCINEDHFSSQEMRLLQRKLEILETMSSDRFGTKVTFFLVDITKARNNDFGDSTIESSGSAQARLLKEEFYRTMIYVAGKLPLWSVLPTAISLNYYNSIINAIPNFSHHARYIDLGDIHAIPTNEFFGASIWQMFKWLKSPFKSVIKMALLEKYIYEYGKKSLLCNQYKDEWMNSGTHLKLAQNDSYYILLKNLVNYFEAVDDELSVRLLLTCFFLKLGICEESQFDNTVLGLKKILLENCMKTWGWSKQNVFEMGSFKTWQYRDIVYLSDIIEKYMVKKYKIVNQRFDRQFQGQSRITPEDRTVLGRKVFIEFSKQPGRVAKVLLVNRSDRYYGRLHLKYLKEDNDTGMWELFNQKTKALQQDEVLTKAKTIEEICAWLIHNHLYNETAVIHLVPNPTCITFDDIQNLYKAMHDFFSPVLKQTISFNQLLMPSKIIGLFVSINFNVPRHQREMTEYTLIYMNSWGEMFYNAFYPDQGVTTLQELKKDIMNRMGIKSIPANTSFYFSKNRKKLSKRWSV